MADALLDLIDSLQLPPTQVLQSTEQNVQGKRIVRKRPRKQASHSEFQGLDWVELLQRSSETVLTDRERQGIYTYLLTLTREALNDLQLKSRPVSLLSTPNAKILYDLDVSDYGMVFQHKTGKQDHQVLLKPKPVSNGPKQARYQVFVPPNDGTFTLTVEPSKGTVSEGVPLSLDFRFEIQGEKPGKTLVDVVVEMLVQGGYRHFFTVKSRTDASSNVIIQTQKLQKDTIFPGYTYTVPKPLVRLRSMLLYAKGLETADLFRTQGATWEVQSLSTHVQKGTYYVCTDPHAIATCLKTYLRSIPPIFAKVPTEAINAGDGFEDLRGYGMEDSEIDIIAWVIDLMALVAMSEKTEMSARSTAIVMAPNLYPISVDTLDGSTQMTNFVSYLYSMLDKRIRQIRPPQSPKEEEYVSDFDEYDDSYSQFL